MNGKQFPVQGRRVRTGGRAERPRFLRLFAVRFVLGGLVPGIGHPSYAGEPQYVFINRAPWFPARDGVRWDQGDPDSFTRKGFESVVRTVGSRGNEGTRLGLHFAFSIMQNDAETLAASLSRLLVAAHESDVPVLITLDGQNWWQGRPDLWNWWDPAAPGYSPGNRLNVEWYGWGPEFAVRGGWRNWGHQVRVAPAPNLASPAFRAEHVSKFKRLVPVISSWYESLPPEKRYLFGGVKVGWEACPHINAYYLRDGNSLLETYPDDTSHDPIVTGAGDDISMGGEILGYAAATTMGIRGSGVLTRDDLARITADYLAFLARNVHELGIPRDRLFTHQGGTFPPWDKHLPFSPAINEWSVPGWSFYAADPGDIVSLGGALDEAGRDEWCAAEWWRGGANQGEWEDRFRATLDFRNCRFLVLYNWDCGTHFLDNEGGLRALRAILEECVEKE